MTDGFRTLSLRARLDSLNLLSVLLFSPLSSLRERALLCAVAGVVLNIDPREQSLADDLPLIRDDGVDGGVAVVAIGHDDVVAEDAFVCCAEFGDCSL